MKLPRLLYGTAWKEDRTQLLTELALSVGFTGVDTANQRKHYHEAAVGQALKGRDVFIQTKFTHLGGQDQRLPYDPNASITTQVEQSFASSIQHLGRVDSYVLHGPSLRRGLADEDWEAWRAMEHLHGAGQTQMLGVSNVNAEQLELLWQGAKVKPAVVQNRCFATMGWDYRVREVCKAHGIIYQGFSLLTANVDVLHHTRVQTLAAARGMTVMQLVFRFALDLDMVVLTGTSNEEHMRQDLAVLDMPSLDAEEIALLEEIAA